MHWINNHTNKFDKIQKHNIYVQNRLDDILRLTLTHSVEFNFVYGYKNAANCITRTLSYKQLSAYNYISGPNLSDFLAKYGPDTLKILIPNPNTVTNTLSEGAFNP